MTAMPPQGPVVKVKPQPNIYTLLLLVAILFVVAATVIATQDLMNTYDVQIGDLFKHMTPPQ